MRRIMVRYTVKPDLAETKAELGPRRVRGAPQSPAEPHSVCDVSARQRCHLRPPLRKRQLRRPKRARRAPSFRRFLDGSPRCDEPPASTDVHEIGSCRVFDHED
jgi:hypothetical protein